MSGGAVAGVVGVCLLAAALLAAGAAYACREKNVSMRSTNPNYDRGSSNPIYDRGSSTAHHNPDYAGPGSTGGRVGAEDGVSGGTAVGDGAQGNDSSGEHGRAVSSYDRLARGAPGDYDHLAGSTPQTRGENDAPNGYDRLSRPQSNYDHLAGSTPPVAGGAPNSYDRLGPRDGDGSSIGYYEAMSVRTATPADYHVEVVGSPDGR